MKLIGCISPREHVRLCLLAISLSLVIPTTNTNTNTNTNAEGNLQESVAATARTSKPGDADFAQPSPGGRHNQKVAAIKTGNYDLVLVGDSITECLESGGEFEPLKAVWIAAAYKDQPVLPEQDRVLFCPVHRFRRQPPAKNDLIP